MTVGYGQDHTATMLGFLLRQFTARPRIAGLLAAFGKDMQAVDNSFQALATMRWLGKATGAQLDGIGQIVGISRAIGVSYQAYFGFIDQPETTTFGIAPLRDMTQSSTVASALGDNVYRSVISLKIILNSAHGTIPEIETALSTAFALSTCSIAVTGAGVLTVNAAASAQTPTLLLASFLQYIPVAAGVTVKLNLTQ